LRRTYRPSPLTLPRKLEGNSSAPLPSISSKPAARRDRVSSTSPARHQAVPTAVRSLPRWPRSHLRPRPIGFADRAPLEQFAKLRQRLAVASEHQTAGRIAVETMRQCWCPWQPESQRAEVVFQAFAATLSRFGTAMNGDAWRLIDHQHQPVAIKEPRHHFFRGHSFRGHVFTEMSLGKCLSGNGFRERGLGAWLSVA